MKHFPCDTNRLQQLRKEILFFYVNDFMFQDLEYIFQDLEYIFQDLKYRKAKLRKKSSGWQFTQPPARIITFSFFVFSSVECFLTIWIPIL